MGKKQRSDQMSKLDRVSKQLVRYAREVRTNKGKTTHTKEEDDIDVRDMADFNKTISKDLVGSIQSYPEAFSTLSNLLYQSNIPIPSVTGPGMGGSRASSRASSSSSITSARSDVSSAKSVRLGVTSPTRK